MNKQIYENIKKSLQVVENSYYHLVLLVGTIDSGKTDVIHNVSKNLGVSVVNLNLALSREMLDLTPRQRSLQLSNILAKIADTASTPLLLDNLEILFDKDLRVDPLLVLQRISRARIVLATWNGIFTGEKLVYAEYGHPEYRSYDSVDALIVSMDGRATVELAE
jgi:hypothetical protein